jgi:hypothetical protein
MAPPIEVDISPRKPIRRPPNPTPGDRPLLDISEPMGLRADTDLRLAEYFGLSDGCLVLAPKRRQKSHC